MKPNEKFYEKPKAQRQRNKDTNIKEAIESLVSKLEDTKKDLINLKNKYENLL